MIARILPPAEWGRLAETGAAAVAGLHPETATVIVIEDATGAIVGCHAIFPVLHAEGLWIHPDRRGKAGVARRLWAGVQAAARARGVRAFMTASADARVTQLLDHVGAQALAGTAYLVPVTGKD